MTANDDPAIQCTALTKRYGPGPAALADLTLTVNSGTGFGLLGENGAGKTTLVRLIMGFVFPSSGQVVVLGERAVSRAHGRIGYVHEHALFETRLTGRQQLAYMAGLSGLAGAAAHTRCDVVLDQVRLRAAADRRIHTYSRGMRQRLAIAQALLCDPKLLVLDEPTGGLDPGGQWEVRQIIGELRRGGRTLLLCSHYLNEVEELCDEVGILRKGQMVRTGTVRELLGGEEGVEIVLAGDGPAEQIALTFGLRATCLPGNARALRVAVVDQQATLAALLGAGIAIRSVNPVARTLEDVYVQATRPPARATHTSGSAPTA
jgi:ABC-2 type transport system ATP-binding protein